MKYRNIEICFYTSEPIILYMFYLMTILHFIFMFACLHVLCVMASHMNFSFDEIIKVFCICMMNGQFWRYDNAVFLPQPSLTTSLPTITSRVTPHRSSTPTHSPTAVTNSHHHQFPAVAGFKSPKNKSPKKNTHSR